MLKKINLVVIAFLFTLPSFAQFKISGKIRSVRPVELTMSDLKGNVVYSCEIESDKKIKSKKLDIVADLYKLKIGDIELLLPLENNEMELVGFLNDMKPDQGNLTLKGQKSASEYFELNGKFLSAIKGKTINEYIEENKALSPLALSAILFERADWFINEVDVYEYILKELSPYSNSIIFEFTNKLVKRRQGYKIGNKFPEWQFEDENGKAVKLSDFKGKIVLMDFWASWCAPCRAEMRHLRKIYDEIKGDDLVIISIAMDEPKDKAKWLKAAGEENIPWVSLWDPAGFYNNPRKETFGFMQIPYLVLLDKDGNTVARKIRGEEVRTQIQSLRNNR